MAESHIRIDEGIKRGPKIPRRSVTRRKNDESGCVEGIPANLDPQSVLELYMGSGSTSHIAKQYNVKRKTLVGWLREQVPEQWKQIQILRALIKKEAAEDEIEFAKDALSLARAREGVKAAQWNLERLDSSNYGQKQEVTVDINQHVTVELALTDQALQLADRIRSVAVQPMGVQVQQLEDKTK